MITISAGRLTLSFVIASLACIGATQAFSDGTMTASNWSFSSTGSGTQTGSQAGTGGDPGSYFNIVSSGGNPVTGSGNSVGLLMSNRWSYNPATSGAISQITFSVSQKQGYYGKWETSYAIKQAGTLFVYGLTPGPIGSWENYVASSSSAFFSETNSAGNRVAVRPDFSSKGAPITFGLMIFFYGQTPPLRTSPFNASYGVDNFKVTISVTPEPPASPVVLAGLGATLLLFRRRKDKP